jgi:hypothetical protein
MAGKDGLIFIDMKRILLLACIAISAARVAAQNPDSLSVAAADSLFLKLSEATVVGEIPVVKVDKGALVYDVQRILEKTPADNAFEAIGKLPGVTPQGDGFAVAGRRATVVIDGKVSTLSADQVNALLKSTPVSRIAKAEVIPNATAKYQVRGALINIVLNHDSEDRGKLQGEIYGRYVNQYNGSGQGRGSLQYAKGKFSTDLTYTYEYEQTHNDNTMKARHRLSDGSVHDIDEEKLVDDWERNHQVRWGADYFFSEKHRASLVYNGSISEKGTDISTTGTQVSTARLGKDRQLHNFRADYKAPFGLSLGAEYTHYNAPSDQLLKSTFEGVGSHYRTEDRQTIDRWKVFAAQEHSLENSWELNYGANLEWARDKSFQWYYDPVTGGKINVGGDDGFISKLNEQSQNVYAGFSKSFSEKWMMNGSLAVEHFKNAAWNDWSVYPTLNVTWLPTAGHIVQLGLSSDKGYPDYWSLQSTTTHSDAYTEIVGNPSLRPSKEYQAALSYILKSKYVFSAYFSHIKDYFIQLLYQNPDRLVQTYRTLNEDFMQQGGIQASIPFNVGEWWTGRTTLIGTWQREKDSDFYDIPFDRDIVFGMAVMNNTFTLSKKHGLKLLVNGMIRSKGIQGNYDLPASGNLDVQLRWGFAEGRGLINIFCNDIFQTSMISPLIDYGGQYMKSGYECYRQAGVSLTWKFGGYTEKKREGLDTGRFR